MASEAEMVRKADLALGELTSGGGLLNQMQADTFLRNLIDQPTILNDARAVPMNAPSMVIEKIGFGTRILKPALQAGGANDSGSNDRHLLEADRSKPDLSKVTLNTTEIMAEVHIHDEILEDNIERGNMQDTILTLIAERAALDLEELIINGDTGSGDTYLALFDGVLKLTTSNVTDAVGAGISINVFNDMKKSLPTRYRRNLNTMRFYTSMDVESDYRVQVASRGTDLGDATLLGNAPLPVLGIPLAPVALMPEANGFLVNPNNFIWGIQRQVRIERDRDIRARTWIIVLTLRVALEIEEETAVVKLINLG